MPLNKYPYYWTGIDGGREGLWREPVWTGVLQIVSNHIGEDVYDENSPIYMDLEKQFPTESWRCKTADGKFRPLFRDYPNSWTRPGVISLDHQRFRLTLSGLRLLTGDIQKSDVLLEMFKNHSERVSGANVRENPFSILASAFIESPRPLTSQEIYWAVMLNYRPGKDLLIEALRSTRTDALKKISGTSFRRLKSMLSTMRAADLVSSSKRGPFTVWAPLNFEMLKLLSSGGNVQEGAG